MFLIYDALLSSVRRATFWYNFYLYQELIRNRLSTTKAATLTSPSYTYNISKILWKGWWVFILISYILFVNIDKRYWFIFNLWTRYSTVILFDILPLIKAAGDDNVYFCSHSNSTITFLNGHFGSDFDKN